MILIPGLPGSPSLVLDAPDLSARQQRVLAVIAAWPLTHGGCPRVRDVCAALGWASPNAAEQPLRVLRERGYIGKESHAASLRLAKPLCWRQVDA